MAKQEPEALGNLDQLLDKWQAEHRELEASVLEISRWMNQDAQRQAPDFPAASARLRQLQQSLQRHFAHEEILGQLLAASRGVSTDEIAAACRQAARDHRTLNSRLDGLLEQLESSPPPATSASPQVWAAIVYEFNLFIDLLEQHEEQEEDSARWLHPRHVDP
ncbi:MAG: hemerythrin domain-containing protein [Planctomycetales bacterium]|nr:hemerythrin domain-containing protein [Planctomycetales bacterium]